MNTHFKTLLIHKSIFFKSNLQKQPIHSTKHAYTQTETAIAEELVLPILSLLEKKKASNAQTCWYHQSFHLIYRHQIKEKCKKKELRYTIGFFHINAIRQILVPYNGKLHKPPTNNHLIAAQQEPYKKACPLTNKKTPQKTGTFSGGKKAGKKRSQDQKSNRTKQKNRR